jgi:hypothetical protein
MLLRSYKFGTGRSLQRKPKACSRTDLANRRSIAIPKSAQLLPALR